VKSILMIFILFSVLACTTNDPRKLISKAHYRMYEQNREVGARNYLNRAIPQAVDAKDNYALVVAYNMLGYTYIADGHRHTNKEPDKAIKNYELAENVAQKNNINCELAHTYIGFSLSYKIKDDKKLSCEYRDKTDKLISKIKSVPSDIAMQCEYGSEELSSIESRLVKLNDYLDC